MLKIFLNGIIRFALHQRLVTIALAIVLLVFGGIQILALPIDVFPNLNRPRVVIMTEAPGMAPEEVEALITFPLETTLNGASGVQAVRTSSGVGISVAYVEFDWGTDIYNDRQVVNERLALVSESLPEGIKPQLAPISSIMGQIVIIGVFSEQNDDTRLFATKTTHQKSLNDRKITRALIAAFDKNGIELSSDTKIQVDRKDRRWFVIDSESGNWYAVVKATKSLEVHKMTPPMEMRTMADWVIRQRLLTIPGVSQVFVMGGGRMQFQVLVNPDALIRYGVTLHEVKEAVQNSNQNTTGGYLDEQGPNELLVRILGRIKTVEELEEIVVKTRKGSSVLLKQVANVVQAPQVKRGDSSAFVRIKKAESGEQRAESQKENPALSSQPSALSSFSGGPAVVLTINKQPDADTREVTNQIVEALQDIQSDLPQDVRVEPDLYQQKEFIDLAVDNVIEALRDGGILVVIILFVFLMNFRTTFITLTAIPLSLVMTGLVFYFFGISINTMTLGGLAVAIGELVDDAIVDVENIFRRLRENRQSSNPKPALLVVFQASVEIRNSIVFGTLIVVLVFLPIFALSGMPGRLFTPLGIAYIISIISSLVVSLTVTPVLSYWLLSKARMMEHEKEGLVLRFLKSVAGRAIAFSLHVPTPILVSASCVVLFAGVAMYQLENDFLPPFNEGSVQVNVLLPPGASLQKSNEISAIVEQRLQEIKEINGFVRKTGRAELDEHAEGVNVSEYVASLDPHSERSREEILEDIRNRVGEITGVVVSVEQPLAHLISHMLSGVKAQVAIKLYGDDLDILRSKAKELKAVIDDVKGIKGLQIEQQVIIRQLRIEIDRHQLAQYGLTRNDINEFVETAMNGDVVSEVLIGQRTFDLVVRMDERFRENIDAVKRLSIDLPDGGTTKLESVARIYPAGGASNINREQVRRRIAIQCNVSGRGLVDVVNEIKERQANVELPKGYFLEYGGQFESQQTASRKITFYFFVSLIGMFLVLYTMFRSTNLSLQVMVALPMAFIGSVAALYVTGQTLTIPAMVGFISLCGIASRNGILLINHYLHLVRHEGETWSREMIVRAGKERLAPVLMTALTSGIGLVPLALAAGEPGKEILYPVATVIIGGLISSTLLEFLVRPALFWKFGVGAGRRVTDEDQNDVKLVEEGDESGEQGVESQEP